MSALVTEKTMADLAAAAADLRKAAREVVRHPRCAEILAALPDREAIELVELVTPVADA
jgi:hypothetical protein